MTGWFRPLSETDMHLIHVASLDILNEIGLVGLSDTATGKIVAFAGLKTKDERITFPRKFIEDTMVNLPCDLILISRDPSCNINTSLTRSTRGQAERPQRYITPRQEFIEKPNWVICMMLHTL